MGIIVIVKPFLNRHFMLILSICVIFSFLMGCSNNSNTATSKEEFIFDFPVQPLEVVRGEPIVITVKILNHPQGTDMPKIEYQVIKSIPDKKNPKNVFEDNKIHYLSVKSPVFDTSFKLDLIVDFDHELNETGFIISGYATSSQKFSKFEKRIDLKIISPQKSGGFDNTFGINGFARIPQENDWMFKRAITGKNDDIYLIYATNRISKYRIKIKRFDKNGKLDTIYGESGNLVLEFGEEEISFVEKISNDHFIIASCLNSTGRI